MKHEERSKSKTSNRSRSKKRHYPSKIWSANKLFQPTDINFDNINEAIRMNRSKITSGKGWKVLPKDSWELYKKRRKRLHRKPGDTSHEKPKNTGKSPARNRDKNRKALKNKKKSPSKKPVRKRQYGNVEIDSVSDNSKKYRINEMQERPLQSSETVVRNRRTASGHQNRSREPEPSSSSYSNSRNTYSDDNTRPLYDSSDSAN